MDLAVPIETLDQAALRACLADSEERIASTAELQVATTIHDSLVRLDPTTFEPQPQLAESWSVSEDGLVWTFKLRSGVKFHDGTDFNAEAVCANFDRWYNAKGLMQSPDVTPYWQDIMGGFAQNEDPELPPSLFKSCTAKDATTVDLAFTRVSSKIPAALMLPSFSMHSPKALEQYDASTVGGTAEDIKYPSYALEHPTGTGPFKFKAWDVANKTLTIERNEDYYGDKAKLKTVIFKTISDENARKQALRSGDIQGYDLVGPADVEPNLPAAGRLVTLEGVGHFMHIEQPRLVADLILEHLA